MQILSIEGKKFRVGDLDGQSPVWTVMVDGESVSVEVLKEIDSQPRVLFVRVGSKVVRVSAQATSDPDTYLVELDGRPARAKLESEASMSYEAGNGTVGPVTVNSPMAGKIAALKVSIGATVEEGQALVVLEAMKMENEIASPKKGVVKEIYVQPGALARSGDKLVLIQ